MGLVTFLALETLPLTGSSISPSTMRPLESHYSTRAPIFNYSDLYATIVQQRKAVDDEAKRMADNPTASAKRGVDWKKRQCDRPDPGAVFLSVTENQLIEQQAAQKMAETAAVRSEANLKNAASIDVEEAAKDNRQDGNIKPASARIGTAPAPGILLMRELSGLIRNECSELFFGIVNLAIQQLSHDKFQQKQLVARLRYMLLIHDGVSSPKSFVVDFTDWAHFSTSRWRHTFFGVDTPSLKLFYHQIMLRKELLAHDLACLDRKGPHIDSFLPQTQLPSPYSSWIMLGVLSALRKDSALRLSKSGIKEKVDVVIASFMENHGLAKRLLVRFEEEAPPAVPSRIPSNATPSVKRVGELVHTYTYPEGGTKAMAIQSLALVPFTVLADFLDNDSGDTLLRRWWERLHVGLTSRQTIFGSNELIDGYLQRGTWVHRVGRNYFPRVARKKEHVYVSASPAMKRLMWCVTSDACRLLESPLSPFASPVAPLQNSAEAEMEDRHRPLLPPLPSLLQQHDATNGSSAPVLTTPAYQRLKLEGTGELLAGNGSFDKEQSAGELPILPQTEEFASRVSLSQKDAVKYNSDSSRQYRFIRNSIVEVLGRAVAYIGCPPWWDKQLQFRLYFIRRLIGLQPFLRSFSHQQLIATRDVPVVPSLLSAKGSGEGYSNILSTVGCIGYHYRELLPNPTSIWVPGVDGAQGRGGGRGVERGGEDNSMGEDMMGQDKRSGGDDGGSFLNISDTDASFTLSEDTSASLHDGQFDSSEESTSTTTAVAPTEVKHMPVIAASYCFSPREANELLVQFAGCLQTIGDTHGLPTGGNNDNGGAQPSSSNDAPIESSAAPTTNSNKTITIGPDGRPKEAYNSPIALIGRISYSQDLWPKVRPTRYMATDELIEFLHFFSAAMLAASAVPKNVRRHYGNCVRQLIGELITTKSRPNATVYFTQLYSLYKHKLLSVLDTAVAYDLHLVGDIPILYLAQRLGIELKEANNGRISRHDAVSNKAAKGYAVVGHRAKQHELKRSQKSMPYAHVDSVASLLDEEGGGEEEGTRSNNNNNNNVIGSFAGRNTLSSSSSGKKKKNKNKNKNRGSSEYRNQGPRSGSAFDE